MQDRSFYINTQVEWCESDKFYKKFVIDSKPCKIKLDKAEFNKIKIAINKKNIEDVKHKELSENSFNILNITYIQMPKIAETLKSNNAYLKYSDMMLNRPLLDMKDYIVIQLEGKKTYALSPASQLNMLIPYREGEEIKKHDYFNPILFKDNIYLNDINIIRMTTQLEEGEMLYIPSYMIRQEITFDDSLSLVYEYPTHSRVLQVFMKVLFDDNNVEQYEM
jgi:hypothetical protein